MLTGYYNAGDCWLVKTDSYGNPEWEKTYGGNDCDAAEDVWQTSDGGFIIVGITNSFGAGNFDIWLIKTDGNGNELWNRTYGGRKMEYGTSVQQTSDGGYIIGGFTGSYGMGGNDAWLVKVDNHGNLEWNKTFGDLFRASEVSISCAFNRRRMEAISLRDVIIWMITVTATCLLLSLIVVEIRNGKNLSVLPT